jgi:archaellum component FlaC
MAGINIGDAMLRVGIDLSDFDSGMQKLNADLKRLQEQSKSTALAAAEMTKVGVAITGIGAGITAFLGLAVKGAADEEAMLIRLSSILSNVGVSFEQVKKPLDDFMMATEKASSVSHDKLYEALIQLVNITGDYEKSLKLLPLALDLAAAKGIDLATASMLVGKVAQGNTTMLARYGIILKEGASASEALAAIQARVGGTAEKYGKSTAGAMAQIKNSIDTVMESIGSVLLPIVKTLADALSTLISWFNKIPSPVKTMGVVLAVLAGALALVIGTSLVMIGQWPKLIQLWTGFKAIVMSSTVQLILHKVALVALTIAGTALRGVLTVLTAAQWLLNVAMNANPIGLIITAIGLLITVGLVLWRHWDKITSFFVKSFKIIGDGVSWLMRILTGASAPVKELTDAEKEAAAATKALADQTKALAEAQALNALQQETLGKDISANADQQEALNKQIADAQDLYSNTQKNAAGYKEEIANLNGVLKGLNKASKDAETELKRLEKAYSDAEKKVSDCEKAIDSANRRLSELSSPRLEGMQAYEDQIFDIDQQLMKLELEKSKVGELYFTGQDEIDRLEKLRRELELTRDIEFAPQLYKLKEGVETVQGLNVETMFGPAWDEIQTIGISLAPGGVLFEGLKTANTELATATTNLDAQKVVVNNYATAIGLVQGQLDIINDKVADVLETQSDGILVLENSLFVAKTTANDLETALGRVKTAAEEAARAIANTPNVPPPTSPTEVPGYGAYVTPAQHGAIAMKPTVLLVGEKAPEAVLPLDKLASLLKGAAASKVVEVLFPFEKLAALLRDERSTKLPDIVFPLADMAARLSDAQAPFIQEVRLALDKLAGILSGQQEPKVPEPFPLDELSALLKDQQTPIIAEVKEALDGVAGLLRSQEPPVIPAPVFPVDELAALITNQKVPEAPPVEFPLDKLATILSDTQTPIVGELRFALDKLANLIAEKPPIVPQSPFPLTELAGLLGQGQAPIVREVRQAFDTLASLFKERQTPIIPEVVFPFDKLAALLVPMNQTAPAQAISINVNVAELVVREEADIHKVGQAIVDTIYLRQGIRT